MAMNFSSGERAVLAICQDNISFSPTPYADMAAAAGLAEAEVITLLKRLKACGAIRRFGASIRHQKAGWTHNAMVAWKATEAEAEKWGPVAARNPHVSHAYYRPSSAADWPYTLYTMVHGRNDEECRRVIGEIAAAWPLKEYAALRSIREFKKTSMRYFD